VDAGTIIHLIAHGDNSPDGLGFWSDDANTAVSPTHLADQVAGDGEGLEASVFGDCFGNGTRAIRAGGP
jgi:hypothetical protein